MKRTTLVAVLGAVTALGGAAWNLVARRGSAPAVDLDGVPLAVVVIALGVAVMLGGLVAALRHRGAVDENDQLESVTLKLMGRRPTIVVRDHRRPPGVATDPIEAAPPWPPPEPHDEPTLAMGAIAAVLGGEEPASLLLTAEQATDLVRSLGQFGRAAIELLAERGMTSGEAMTATLDRAAVNRREGVNLTVLVWPDGPTPRPAPAMPRPESSKPGAVPTR